MSKTTRTIRNISRFSILLAFREAYIYVRNLFGLTQHPQLTISRIFKEKDKSQFLLIFGLPFYLFAAGIVFIFALKKLLFGHIFYLGFWAKSGLIALALFSLASFIYLFYWVMEIMKYKKRGKKCR